MSLLSPFKISSNNEYTVITMDDGLNFSGCRQFESSIAEILVNPLHTFIDCNRVTNLPIDWVRAFAKLEGSLSGHKKKFFLLNVSTGLLTSMKKEGVERMFQIASNLVEACEKCGVTPKKKMDAEFIDPFLLATMHVLSVQANLESSPGKPVAKKSGSEIVGDISGIIGIVSDSFKGSVVITFPEQTFLKIMSKMLDEEITKIDKSIVDGAGEITNMIFGHAKVILNEKKYGIQTAIPSVVTGKDHSLSALTSGPVVVIPFVSEAGKFFVEICLSE